TAHDTAGRLVGIAPCCVKHGKVFRFKSVRAVEFLGYGEDVCSEYLDFITAPQDRAQVVDGFFDYFLSHKTDWDVLNLTDLLENSQILDYSKGLQRRNGFHLFQTESACCPYTLLPDNWEAYIGTLSASTRYNIRRKIRKLERNFKVNFFSWSDTNTLESAISKLVELHTKRWVRQNIHYSFSDKRFNDFHQKIAKIFHELGFLRLYALELDEHLVAMLYCYKYGDKLFYYQSGFDPDYSKYGVGTVVFAYAIQDAIAEHTNEFDFLRGYHSYKYRWAEADRRTVRVAIRRNTFAGRVYFLDAFGKNRTKKYLKEHLPSRMYQFLKYGKQLYSTPRQKDVGKTPLRF
ncbi:MAG: GNAT family N-acetyltransferase, partial [Deltaproteobacteria bacterium]|nr:GNAT family N-acetyltransferase [Deltaproteobacteria bacterium]